MLRFGWIKDKIDSRDIKYTLTNISQKFPSVFSLKDNMPVVLDQGQLGSCTANAICNALCKLSMNENIDSRPRSRLFVYYNERDMEGSVNEDNGAQIRDGIKSINDKGACFEETWKYDISNFTKKPTENCYEEAKQHKTVQYRRVEQNEQDIKSALSTNEPVIFGFVVYESIRNKSVATSGIVPYPKKDEQQIGGHAIILTGWNDKTRLFQFQNSWGESWGDKGFGYLPYKYVLNSELANDFWLIQKTN
jgi:C1A family cysteine protease